MKYIIGNWKMNKTIDEATQFIMQLSSFLTDNSQSLDCSVFVAPPSIHLPVLREYSDLIHLTAQDISSEDSGAYTGEISATMLSVYVKYVIVGHSERRKYFNETDNILYKKILMVLKNHMRPIFCVGEKKENRDASNYFPIINQQLNDTVMLLADNDLSNCMIAYEPVWAIGTGDTASVHQIEEVHSYIRALLVSKIGKYNGEKIPILYGGSCTAENSLSILRQKNVDGLLVGGASLDFVHFTKIIQLAHKLS